LIRDNPVKLLSPSLFQAFPEGVMSNTEHKASTSFLLARCPDGSVRHRIHKLKEVRVIKPFRQIYGVHNPAFCCKQAKASINV